MQQLRYMAHGQHDINTPRYYHNTLVHKYFANSTGQSVRSVCLVAFSSFAPSADQINGDSNKNEQTKQSPYAAEQLYVVHSFVIFNILQLSFVSNKTKE